MAARRAARDSSPIWGSRSKPGDRAAANSASRFRVIARWERAPAASKVRAADGSGSSATRISPGRLPGNPMRLAQPAAMTLPPRVTWQEWRRHFLSLLRPYRVAFVLAHVAMMTDALFTTMRPWPLKVVIDSVIQQRHSRVPLIGHWLDARAFDRMTLLYGACGASLLIALGTGLSTFYYTRTMGSIGEHFTFDLRRKLFAHMQRLSLRFHDRQRTGDLTTRLGSEVQAIQDIIANGLIMLGSNFFLL